MTSKAQLAAMDYGELLAGADEFLARPAPSPAPDQTPVMAISAEAQLRARAHPLLAPPALPGDEAPASVAASIADADLAARAKEFLTAPLTPPPAAGPTASEAIAVDALLRAEADALMVPPALPGDEPAVAATAGVADADLPARAAEFMTPPEPPPVDVPPVEVITAEAQLRAGAAEYLTSAEPPDPAAEVTAAIGAGARLRADADEVMLRYNKWHGSDGKFSSGAGPGGPVTGQAALDAAPAALVDGVLVAPGGAGDAESLSAYKSIRYVEINGHLRGTYEGPNAAVAAERVAQIDKTMRVSRLRDDVQVYRVVKDGRAAYGDAYSRNSDLTDLRWREDAYVSTTADAKTASRLSVSAASMSGGSPVVLTIRSPAGTGAINLGGQLDELLLDRGLMFEVTADHGMDAGDVRHLDVAVVPDAG